MKRLRGQTRVTEKDVKELARVRKDSFAWYQRVIASNGADLD